MKIIEAHSVLWNKKVGGGVPVPSIFTRLAGDSTYTKELAQVLEGLTFKLDLNIPVIITEKCLHSLNLPPKLMDKPDVHSNSTKFSQQFRTA